MAYLSPRARVSIAVAVLGFLYLIPSIVLGACTLCLCRRKRDPARWSFTWLKVAYAFWVAFLFFYVLAYVLNFLLYYGVSSFEVRRDDLEIALTAVSTCATTAERIANLVIFLTLVHLGLGILLARTGKRARLHNIASYAALGVFAVLVVLAIAYFGVWIHQVRLAIGARSRPYSGSYDSYDAVLNAERLDGVVKIFEFILSIAVLAFAISVLVKVAGKYEQLKAAAVFFLVCAVLWWIRNLYEIIYFGRFSSFDSLFVIRYPPYYLPIIRFLFSVTPSFIILVMLFALGRKKMGGLWSTAQQVAFVPPTTQPQQQWGQGQQYTYPPPPPGYVYASPPAGQGWQQPQYVPVQQGMYPQMPQPGQQPYVDYGQVQTPEAAMSGVSSVTDQSRMHQAPPTQEPADGIYHQADGRPPQDAEALRQVPKAELAGSDAKA